MKISALLPLVGIFLFVFILLNVNIGQTFQILSKANIWFILLAMSISILSVVIKSLKWRAIIRVYGEYGLGSSVKSWFMGFSLGMVTPARIGDFSRAYSLKNKIGLVKGVVTVVVDRILDIAILFCFATISFASFASILREQFAVFFIISAIFALFLAGVYIFTRKGAAKFLLKPLFYRIVPEKHKSGMSSTFQDFYGSIGSVKRRTIAYAALLGILAWLATVLQYYLLALSIGLGVSYLFLLLVMPVVLLLDLLPISFAGLGTRDAALILFFSFASIGREYALSFSLLVFIFSYVFIGLIGAAFILRSSCKKH
jgi:uncharacterized protein (TIRG00374 family)